MWFMNHVIRPVVAAILRSPLHPLLSRSVMLVTYHGRRTGRMVSVPVQYEHSDEHFDVRVGAPDHKTWWHNFETERPATLLVHGERIEASGRAFRNGDDVFMVFETDRAA